MTGNTRTVTLPPLGSDALTSINHRRGPADRGQMRSGTPSGPREGAGSCGSKD